jgi:hypothetical protein
MESDQQEKIDYARYVNLAKSLSSENSTTTDHEPNTPNSDMFNPYPWLPSKSEPMQNKTKTPNGFSIFTTPKKQNCYIPDYYTELVETAEVICEREANWLSIFACVVFLSIVLALVFIISHNSVRTNWHT